MSAPLAGVIATDVLELGQGMRRLRGNRGLRQLEERQESTSGSMFVSRSSLSRYEQGTILPAIKLAAHLDWLYGAEGWLDVSIRSLWRSSWNPWEADVPRKFHSYAWPAAYGGMVWMKVRPTLDSVGLEHRLVLEWGPWGREVVLTLPAAGGLITTGKSVNHDGISRDLNVTADRPLHVLFGAGEELLHESVTDIRRGWELANPQAAERELTSGPDLGG